MIKKIIASTLILAAFSVPSFAATAAAEFYVAQDVKSHLCMVADKKPDGKLVMDVGTKAYATKGNAETAMTMLKACSSKAAAAAAPAAATFYVEQDAKSHKCMVGDKKPDGKLVMDVGTKIYATKANAETAMAMLKVCKI